MRNLIRVIALQRRRQEFLHRGTAQHLGFVERTVNQSARKCPRVNAQVHRRRRRVSEVDGKVAVIAPDDLRRTAAESERSRLGRVGRKELERLREQLFEAVLQLAGFFARISPGALTAGGVDVRERLLARQEQELVH